MRNECMKTIQSIVEEFAKKGGTFVPDWDIEEEKKEEAKNWLRKELEARDRDSEYQMLQKCWEELDTMMTEYDHADEGAIAVLNGWRTRLDALRPHEKKGCCGSCRSSRVIPRMGEGDYGRKFYCKNPFCPNCHTKDLIE